MIDHKHKFIFIHIPKCGGVSVEKHLGWGGVRHHTMEFYMKKYAGLNLDEYYKFTFVRNPWIRLVSWYFYHIKKFETSYPRDFKEWVKTGMKSHWNKVDGTYWGDKYPINCQSWINLMKNNIILLEKRKTFKKTSIQSATKLESHNNNFHIKTKANINTTPNITMTKQEKSLRKNTQKTLSILGINLENKMNKTIWMCWFQGEDDKFM